MKVSELKQWLATQPEEATIELWESDGNDGTWVSESVEAHIRTALYGEPNE